MIIYSLIISNIIVAIIFTVGHLPVTMSLTPLILIRYFLMNGAYSLVFGYLYRKYGIEYSIMCH